MTSVVLYFISALFVLLAGIPIVMILTESYDPFFSQKMGYEVKKDPLRVIGRLKICVFLWLIAWVVCSLAWALK